MAISTWPNWRYRSQSSQGPTADSHWTAVGEEEEEGKKQRVTAREAGEKREEERERRWQGGEGWLINSSLKWGQERAGILQSCGGACWTNVVYWVGAAEWWRSQLNVPLIGRTVAQYLLKISVTNPITKRQVEKRRREKQKSYNSNVSTERTLERTSHTVSLKTVEYTPRLFDNAVCPPAPFIFKRSDWWWTQTSHTHQLGRVKAYSFIPSALQLRVSVSTRKWFIIFFLKPLHFVSKFKFYFDF